MVIYPLLHKKKVYAYRSGPIYSSLNGQRLWISDSEEAPTREALIAKALIMAQILRTAAVCRIGHGFNRRGWRE
jgi:hypothetical protein